MSPLRKVCIEANRDAVRSSVHYVDSDSSIQYGSRMPQEFIVEDILNIGEVAYRLEDHGSVRNPRCGKGDDWHTHVSADVAGFVVTRLQDDMLGDKYVYAQLICEIDINYLIMDYLFKEKNVCKSAIDFQIYIKPLFLT